MNTIDCINQKRSVRKYTNKPIDKETINDLIRLGTKASTGSNMQPWGFVVIQDRNEIEDLSDSIKQFLLNNLEQFPYLEQYREWLNNKHYSIFNHAGTLLLVYGDTHSHWYIYDCTLATANIMLAAHSMGIGTCWIGFGEYMLNTPEFKNKYKVPVSYQLVSPISMGYFSTKMSSPERKAPIIFNWAD